jgi:hypothetical protein
VPIVKAAVSAPIQTEALPARRHMSLRMSPAMAAGVSRKLWTIEDIVKLID